MQLGSKTATRQVRIPYYRAQAVGREQEYIADAAASGRIGGSGPYARQCESILREMTGAPVLVTKSCTAALELMGQLLDLQPGDEVILPAFAYITTASSFAIRGARIVFADVRPDTLCIDPESVRRCLSPRTRAVVALHYSGVACDLDELDAITREAGVVLVEDNAHGAGGTYRGKPLGAIGSMGAMSFHETKNITCGEGGALVLGDNHLLERAEILAQKGTDRAQFLRGQVSSYTWVDVGSSYQLSDLHSAFLLGQLEQRQAIADQRQRLWHRYAAELADWADAQGVRLPTIPEDCESTHHIFQVLLPDMNARDRFLHALLARGIQGTFHYQPLNVSPVGQAMGGVVGGCPVSEDVSGRLARLPMFHGLSDDEQGEVIEAARRFRV